ncbi:hypothetical protein H2248_004478 [Termitomyces sp. 'cryptogamus']|nr:hypothetical protein H2248_004478 [Termitomyces sp. 'cryptogamus']
MPMASATLPYLFPTPRDRFLAITTESSDTMSLPLVSHPSSPFGSNESVSFTSKNIQFFILSAHGLPEPPPADLRTRRIVRASCSNRSQKYEQYRTNPSASYYWSENTSQIGPVFGNDQVTFSVELHTPLQVVKRFANTVATSASYTINSLLEMQANAKDESISIPLRVNKKGHKREASLLLRVKQPTATFISEQLQEEVARLSAEKGRERKSTQTLSPELHSVFQLDAGPSYISLSRVA